MRKCVDFFNSNLCSIDATAIVMRVMLVAMALIAGCESSPDRNNVRGEYRTTDAQPLRNTNAAKDADQEGLTHLDAGEIEKAAKAFKRALSADVEYGPAHNNLGKVYYFQEDYYNAAWEFEYAIRLMPRHAAPRNNLGLVLERAGELDQAVDRYREAVGLDGDNVTFRANLARALIHRGDRTAEVRNLLEEILATDTRADWLIWARNQLSRLGE